MVNFIFSGKSVISAISAYYGYFGSLVEFGIFKEILNIVGLIFFELGDFSFLFHRIRIYNHIKISTLQVRPL